MSNWNLIFVHPRIKRFAIFNLLLTVLVVLGSTFSLAMSRELNDSTNDLENEVSELVRIRFETRALGVPDSAALNKQIAEQTKLALDGKNEVETRNSYQLPY